MPKMKTHSGAKKRFRKTATGKLRARHAFTSHNLGQEAPQAQASPGGPVVVAKADRKRVRELLHDEPRQALRPRPQEAPRHARARQGLPRPGAPSYKRAKEALLKADRYAYRDRRNRKRDFRRLWITRINAAARREGMSYSQFMHGSQAGDRARPQGAGRHRRARPRDVPTFCRARPGGCGCLTREPTRKDSRGAREAPFSLRPNP